MSDEFGSWLRHIRTWANGFICLTIFKKKKVHLFVCLAVLGLRCRSSSLTCRDWGPLHLKLRVLATGYRGDGSPSDKITGCELRGVPA